MSSPLDPKDIKPVGLDVPEHISVSGTAVPTTLPEVPVTEPPPKTDYLTDEEYKKALKEEIETKLEENDLTELQKGNLPIRLAAKYEQKAGIWRIISMVLRFIGKFI
jgi:hypothetical protein